MIVVVSDTSPIRALCNLGLPTLLSEIYSEVIVPPEVESGLRHPPSGQSVIDLAKWTFIKIQVPSNEASLRDLLEGLDRGESEAIALAIELHADLILIDESEGRDRAKRAGLSTIGLLGILLEAKDRKLIGSVTPLLDRLRDDYRFFITPQLRARILRLAGEEP